MGFVSPKTNLKEGVARKTDADRETVEVILIPLEARASHVTLTSVEPRKVADAKNR